MGNCLKTQLKEGVNNDNLPIFNKIVVTFDGTNSNAVTRTINDSPWSSLFVWQNGVTGDATIISGNATFDNGTKSARIEDKPSITVPAGEVVRVAFDEPYKIKYIYMYSETVIDGSIIKYLPLSDGYMFMLNRGKTKVKVADINSNINILRIGLTTLYGSIKNLNFPALQAAYYADMYLNNVEPYTLEEAIALFEKANGDSVYKNWSSIISIAGSSCTGGDVSSISKNVELINLTPNIQFTCTLGRRNTSDCKILCSASRNSLFKTPIDVDNFLINNAGCTLGSTSTIIDILCSGTYTPSLAAQTAIATLKEKGITSIKVNNVEL